MADFSRVDGVHLHETNRKCLSFSAFEVALKINFDGWMFTSSAAETDGQICLAKKLSGHLHLNLSLYRRTSFLQASTRLAIMDVL